MLIEKQSYKQVQQSSLFDVVLLMYLNVWNMKIHFHVACHVAIWSQTCLNFTPLPQKQNKSKVAFSKQTRYVIKGGIPVMTPKKNPVKLPCFFVRSSSTWLCVLTSRWQVLTKQISPLLCILVLCQLALTVCSLEYRLYNSEYQVLVDLFVHASVGETDWPFLASHVHVGFAWAVDYSCTIRCPPSSCNVSS